MVRTFIYSLSNFQICNNSIAKYSYCAIQYIPGKHLLYNWKFVPFDQYLPIPPTHKPPTATILLCFWGRRDINKCVELRSYSICLSPSALFHLAGCPQDLFTLSQRAGFPLFSWQNNTSLYIFISHLIHRQTLRFFQYLGYCE